MGRHIPILNNDGSRIAYISNDSGHFDIFVKDLSQPEREQSLLVTTANKYPTDWSRDGRFLIYETLDAKTKRDIWVLPLFGDRKPWALLNSEYNEQHVDNLLRVPWAALVFDEAHYLKNHTSARSKLARQLTIAAAAARPALAVQLLTGTPLTSRPRDLFVLLQLAAHPLGRSFLAFAKRYCAAEKGDYGWKTGGASNIEELTVQLHGVM